MIIFFFELKGVAGCGKRTPHWHKLCCQVTPKSNCEETHPKCKGHYLPQGVGLFDHLLPQPGKYALFCPFLFFISLFKVCDYGMLFLVLEFSKIESRASEWDIFWCMLLCCLLLFWICECLLWYTYLLLGCIIVYRKVELNTWESSLMICYPSRIKFSFSLLYFPPTLPSLSLHFISLHLLGMSQTKAFNIKSVRVVANSNMFVFVASDNVLAICWHDLNKRLTICFRYWYIYMYICIHLRYK